MRSALTFLKSILTGFLLLSSSLAGYAQEDKPTGEETLTIGSKLFTESVILGEIAVQLAEHEGIQVQYYDQLGGSRILWNALLQGEIDVYPEYTGTIILELLQQPDIRDKEELREELRKRDIIMSPAVGFNNSYAIGMKSTQAEKLNITSISGLREHPGLKHGYSNEFINREDGWKGLREAYGLNPDDVTGLDHDLAYRGLESGAIDLTDLYTTDAEIQYYDLKVLEDDRGFFPEYEAVYLYRAGIEERFPSFADGLARLESRIDENTMISMNAAVKLEGKSSRETASAFMEREFGMVAEYQSDSFMDRLLKNTGEHLYLVGISLFCAIIAAIPLGILAAKKPKLEQLVLSVTGILQTIPSLALLVFMIPLFGIGAVPAMAALFLYSLLPVVRNTHSGIKNISPELRESAIAMGLSDAFILKKIELPLALPTILAGIKTSAVINVGTATLGALIGAGGYGQPILTGIRLDSMPLILEGAIPAALLALAVQGVFDLIEKYLTIRDQR